MASQKDSLKEPTFLGLFWLGHSDNKRLTRGTQAATVRVLSVGTRNDTGFTHGQGEDTSINEGTFIYDLFLLGLTLKPRLA